MVVDSNRGMSLMVEGGWCEVPLRRAGLCQAGWRSRPVSLISEFKVQCGAEVVYEWCQ